MSGGFERFADLETAPTPKIPSDGFATGVTPPAEIAAGSADRITVAFMDNGCQCASAGARRRRSAYSKPATRPPGDIAIAHDGARPVEGGLAGRASPGVPHRRPRFLVRAPAF